MNYKVLYRKYRPDGFDNLIGQEHVVDILKNSIKEGKIAHAYLFSGPRGTGKTSTARILAKSVNCLDNKSGVACGKCSNCEAFKDSPDIIEIDAASNNGVDEIRELINNVKIMPTSYRYKVYIIDEVHMLSQSAFNALLLTLEEPPEHVIFILATTNLESVPITIVSRCQRFDFHRISNKDIVERLRFVCGEEQIKFDDSGLEEIASLADGGLRDALSILDQLSKNNEVITADMVSKEIGSISDVQIKNLIKALDENDYKTIENIFSDFQETNLNYKVIVKKIIYNLSLVGSSILDGTYNGRLNYDVCKKLVIELNDLLNKINISVDAYILIKMVFLDYLNKEVEIPKIEIKSKMEVPVNKPIEQPVREEKIKPVSAVTPKNNEVDDNNINIRVNNCFVKASKTDLNTMKSLWDDFCRGIDNAQLKGLVADTMVVTASPDYAILVATIPHKEKEIFANIENIEENFKNFANKSVKFAVLTSEKWNIEKEKYIKNIKNGYVYQYMEESSQNEELDMAMIGNVFDINKIEVE